MIKQATLLLCALSALANADLADDAQEQLDQLQEIVQGDILAAHDELQNILLDFKSYEDNVGRTSDVSIQQTRESIVSELNQIKDLAASAGKDITPCTNIRQPVLDRLPGIYSQQITRCIVNVDDEAVRATADARYIIDVVINNVQSLQYQLTRCRGDLLCISPILTQIELDKIRLPQNIETEVGANTNLLATMKLSVQSCGDNNLSQYETESYAVFGGIQDCANNIL